MAEGVVAWFNGERGYGYLVVLACAAAEGRVGDEVFVHYRQIQKNGYKTLDEGEHVSFDIERDATGKSRARLVTPLGGPPPQYLLDVHAAVQKSRPAASRADSPVRDSGRIEATEHHIFKSGRTIVLERGLRWDSAPDTDPLELERMSAHHGVRALVSLCEGLIMPGSFNVTRRWVDEEFGVLPGGRPPRWNWFLTTPDAPSRISSGYVDPQVIETETVDERSMLDAVDGALDDPCTAPDGARLAWEELLIDHTWARLPEPDRHLEGGDLRIDDYDNGGRPRIPLEHAHGHVWATSPSLGVWDPFMLRVTKAFGTEHPDGLECDEVIHLDINVHWSFWWEPGEGRAMLDRAVGRLLYQGWRYAYPE